MWPFRRKPEPAPQVEREQAPYPMFSTDMRPRDAKKAFESAIDRIRTTQPQIKTPDGVAMDGASRLKDVLNLAVPNLPDAVIGWFSAQTFIGHQLAAIVAQHWLVDKACTMPARDAIRHGYETSVSGLPDGMGDGDIVEDLKKADKKYRVRSNMEQFVRMGRVFGVRIALFEVESTDPDYYLKPFNPDGVTKGSYKGIRQVDPYWCAPELDAQAVSNPASADFYEPTWWRIKEKRYHRSHLCIFRNSEVPDILKPAYLYGGVPVPQQIMERIYAAERTANEAPQLAMTKRTMIWMTDTGKILADQDAFLEHMEVWNVYRDNFGVKLINNGDTVQQFDTTLADLDTVIMTQYQIVAAAAKVPATKLLGTTPKGFNSTGEYEESSYHEELESIQTNDLTPLLERHHLMVMRSEIAPEHGLDPDDVEVLIDWNPVDSPTAKEYAEINEINSRTAANLVNAGAIDGMDVRNRLKDDKNGGYVGIADIAEPDNPNDPDANLLKPPTDSIKPVTGSIGSGTEA